jgi:KipI family sensor histidine kinase inhibitor
MNDYRIVAAGDAAWVIEWPARIDPAVSARAVALADHVRQVHPNVRDAVVGYCTVTVYFDPLQGDVNDLEVSLHRLVADLPEATPADGARIDVDVCYGGEFGPDLADVAASAGLSVADVIDLHRTPTYRVYVVGFVPGFPYMATVDDRIALPRRPTPRTRVPAGSVAIASGQTGIYPSETPGGWHLIGRTRVKPYDPSRSKPFLFKPGDSVRFHPIDRAEYDRTA